MEEIETKLRRLAPRAPSTKLDARIAEALAGPGPGHSTRRRPRSVSLPWALAAAFAMGLLGFAAGRFSSPQTIGSKDLAGNADRLQPAVTVRVVYEGSGKNPFDFTIAADDGIRPTHDFKPTPGV